MPRDRTEAYARASGRTSTTLDEKPVHAAARSAVAEFPEYLRAVEQYLSGIVSA